MFQQPIYERLSVWVKQHLIWTIGVVILLLGLIGGGFWYYHEEAPADPEWTTASSTSESQVPTTSSRDPVYVDVKGAVRHPGVYTVTSASRVKDVIELAGGMTDQAEARAINLAQKLTDQAVVYVPTVGEQVADTWSNPSQTSGESTTTKININTADATALMSLNGIGEKKAQAIIAYRTQKGGFTTLEELKEVDGFGEKTVEKLKDSITIE